MTENEAKNIISWDKFQELEDIIINKYKAESAETALYYLYSQIPPRRSKDYRLMMLNVFKPKNTNKNVNDEFSKDKNHYVVNKDGDLLFMIFNIYKSQRHYGQQIFLLCRGC